MDPNLANTHLQQINTQINAFEANPAIPVEQKGEVHNWRRTLDNITRDFQRETDSIQSKYERKYTSAGDTIQSRINDIVRRFT